MWPYLSLSCRNPYTIIWSNCLTLWSLRQFSCIPTPASTLSTSCCSWILNLGCCCVGCVLGHFCHILCNICSLWGSFSFPYFHPLLYSCDCGPCMMWSVLFELVATVIATWKGRGSGDCALFICLFVYAILFWVLVPRCSWLWRRLFSPRSCPTGIVVLISLVPIVGASSSPDSPYPPIPLAPSLYCDLSPFLMWRGFEVLCGWNPRCGCDCICIWIQSCCGSP